MSENTAKIIKFPVVAKEQLPTAEQIFELFNRLPPQELAKLYDMLRKAWIEKYVQQGIE